MTGEQPTTGPAPAAHADGRHMSGGDGSRAATYGSRWPRPPQRRTEKSRATRRRTGDHRASRVAEDGAHPASRSTTAGSAVLTGPPAAATAPANTMTVVLPETEQPVRRAAVCVTRMTHDPTSPAVGPSRHGHHRALADWWRTEAAAYADGEDRPLGSLLGLMGGHVALVAGVAGLAWTRGARLPDRIDTRDVVLAGVATHKLARLITKASVTSPLRAPFTRFAGTAGPAQLAEEVRGTGLRKAMGELVTCPFCVGEWVATGLTAGLVLAPRATRAVTAVFVELKIADFLQLAYAAAQQGEQQLGD